MGIVRFDPFREMERLQNEVNRLFEGPTHAAPPSHAAPTRAETTGARLWSPAIDVSETAEAIVLHAELPGMRQEDIDIELAGDTITLRGERKFSGESSEGGGERWLRVERSFGKFSRSFTLATPIRHDRVSATFRDGILAVTLPKSEEQLPRKVQVVAG